MRWKYKDPFRWRRWFAWYPVKIGGEAVWLEIVERRFTGDGYQIRALAGGTAQGDKT